VIIIPLGRNFLPEHIMSHKAKLKFSAGAVGAIAVGSFAIGALAIGKLAVRKGSLASLEIGELKVGRVKVKELQIEDNLQLPAGHGLGLREAA
jgi:hypothetical protein